jgi:hypothetical protein
MLYPAVDTQKAVAVKVAAIKLVAVTCWVQAEPVAENESQTRLKPHVVNIVEISTEIGPQIAHP